MLLILYVIGLCVYFPNFVDKEHTFAYEVLLIGAISISFFAQYYFGLVDRLFMMRSNIRMCKIISILLR